MVVSDILERRGVRRDRIGRALASKNIKMANAAYEWRLH